MDLTARREELKQAFLERYDVEWKPDSFQDGISCKYQGFIYSAYVTPSENVDIWPDGFMYSFGRRNNVQGTGFGEPTLDRLIEAFDRDLPRKRFTQLSLFDM